jgi:hypothetical protein
MKKRGWFKPLSMATALITAPAVFGASCGYVLHPERRGRTGGPTDTRILVFDILWFLAGIIPGVVFLIVDYTSGCIYGDGRVQVDKAKGKFAVRLPELTQPTALELRLLSQDGKVLDRARATVKAGPAMSGQLSVDLERGARVARTLGADTKHFQLELVGENGKRARLPVTVR